MTRAMTRAIPGVTAAATTDLPVLLSHRTLYAEPSEIGFSRYRADGTSYITSRVFYVLTKRETGNWNHQNPDLQRWWQKIYIDGISDRAVEAGHDEWFVFDAEEKVLAKGRIDSDSV